MKCTLQFVLFGSQAVGNARPGSDFDVLLVGEELVKQIVPQPLPHDETGFYARSMNVREHHRSKHLWSAALWQRLGGDLRVIELRQRAIKYLASLGHSARQETVDLFLYLPPAVSPHVWAVELAWQETHARLDFVCDDLEKLSVDYPELGELRSQILCSAQTPYEQSLALEKMLHERTANSVSDDYRHYGSLGELLRSVPRNLEAVALTGLV